ncbi:AAA domain-domain-containing protein [Absidia repens]|uniref:AAA domain-domain-containing protein n=1 Tax=Absidia repens TaxID=90262 RepID=A0A1X2IE77_9FUNG|nr:AAA domain-domain-containing protein [Absidia repens]
MEKVNHFFNILEQFDQDRLKAGLSTSTTKLTEQHSCAITELVCFPYYLTIEDTSFCAFFDHIQTTRLYPTLEYNVVHGVALLAFHHHRLIRLWALKLLAKYGTEDSSNSNILPASTQGLVSVARPSFDLTLYKYDDNDSSNAFTLRTTQEKSELWKGLRLILELIPADSLAKVVDGTSMITLLQHQLASTSANTCLPAILKTMEVLWTNLQDRFWDKDTLDTTSGTVFYNTILKRICDHPGFRNATKIAQQGTSSTVLMRDGRVYPQEKLVLRMQEMVGWIFPFWYSLRSIADVDFMTDRVLDTLLGYFQLATWSSSFRKCAALVAFQVIQDRMTENTGIPTSKLNSYAPQWVPFALSNPDSATPCSLVSVQRNATTILSDLLCQDTRLLRDTYITLARSSSSPADDHPSSQSLSNTEQQDIVTSSYEKVWAFLQLQPATTMINILPTLLSAYASLVSVHDMQQSTVGASNADMSSPLLAKLMTRMQNLRGMVSMSLAHLADAPWEVRESLIGDSIVTVPLVAMLSSSDSVIRHSTCKLMTRIPTMVYHPLRFLYDHHPQLTVEGLTHVLKDFMELSNARIETYGMVTALAQALSCVSYFLVDNEDGYLLQLVMASAGNTDESNDMDQQIIKDFWNSVWQVLSTVFSSSLQWATKYKPKEILDRVMPWMDIATQIIGCRSLFQKVVCNDSLDVDTLISSVDGLSSWIYVTRRSVLAKLVPLLDKILRQLQQLYIKISLDAYDRLMTAATGMNASRLEQQERELIFLALSAHEPANVIFLDDSDDEDMEWQTIPAERPIDFSTPGTATTSPTLSPPTMTEAYTSPPTRKSPTNEAHTSPLSPVSPYFTISQSSSHQSSRPRQSTLSESFSKTTLLSPEAANIRPHDIPRGATSTAAPLSTLATKPASRVFPQAVKPSNNTYAVTSSGRKLRQPTMGYSKVQQLREESKAERRLGATAKSPSAIAMERKQRGLGSDEDDSSDDDDSDDDGDESGLLGLVNDQQQPASIQALFDTDQPRRTIKLIDIPGKSQTFMQQRSKARLAEKERKMKVMPDIDRLYKSILSWSLENTKSDTPPNTSRETFNHVQDTYEAGYQDYFNVFEPLLLLEVWSQFVRAKEMLNSSDVMDRFMMASRCHVNDFVDVTFQVPLAVNTTPLATDDLVCIANHFGPDFFSAAASGKNDHKQWHGKAFLAKVMAVTQRKSLAFFRLSSLLTVQREYSALQGLRYYELANDIMHPHPTAMPTLPPQAVKDCIRNYGVNQPQAEAIVGALKKKKGFTLIQGPPGTGKTKTILGLIVNLIDQQRHQATKKVGCGKVLVCAPSNAAVDEIAKRLKDGVVTSEGLVKPKVVRIGVMDSVNASVKDLVLDRLIEQELAPSLASDDNNQGNKNFAARRDKIQENMRTLQLDIEQVDRDLSSTKEMRKLTDLRDKRKQLLQQRDRQRIVLKDLYEVQRDYSKEMDAARIRARQKVFADCDIVCATLSGSGHHLLSEMGLIFDTVIVDEAAQAVEVSSLIPLKYDCKRCILVGDPNQLPPTVISLGSSFVISSSIQYRMHPHISAFPSALFYQSRLLDGPKMDEKTAAIWHKNPNFPPYIFFNVKDGQEKQGYGASLFNTSEADAAVTLVDKLASFFPGLKLAYKIGIITPYKQQVSQLKSRFERRFGSKILNTIDFNTVDGFQGQEKDIIIFSCVRANSGNGNTIGFLSDIRRMNVGLTRAKRSLFILGHAKSLQHDEYWGNLVEDAKERKMLQEVSLRIKKKKGEKKTDKGFYIVLLPVF